MNIDLWLKRIWLVIGSLILLGLIIVGIILLVGNVFSSDHNDGVIIGNNSKPKGVDSTVVQDLSIERPQYVGKTNLLYIGVGVKELTSEVSTNSLMIYKYAMEPYRSNLVNIIFSNQEGSNSYLLLDKKAWIKTADIPSVLDSLQNYHLYNIAFEDTDHDGRISANDSSQLYVSDINGLNLTQITQKGDHLEWYTKSKNSNELFILIKQKPINTNIKPEDWPERLYRYEINQRKLTLYPLQGLAFENIRNIIWNN